MSGATKTDGRRNHSTPDHRLKLGGPPWVWIANPRIRGIQKDKSRVVIHSSLLMGMAFGSRPVFRPSLRLRIEPCCGYILNSPGIQSMTVVLYGEPLLWCIIATTRSVNKNHIAKKPPEDHSESSEGTGGSSNFPDGCICHDLKA